MRPSPFAFTLVLAFLSLSGCLGASDTKPLSADPDAPEAEDPPLAESRVAEAGERLPSGTGYLLVQHFEGQSEVGETVLIGYWTSLGRGIHVADVQVPANATGLQFELRHDATLDADPYVFAPRDPCGEAGRGAETATLTGYVRDEEGLYADRGDGAHATVRLDADALERHGCDQSCPDVRTPEYGRTCRTWQLGFRVDPASGPFAWEAAFTAAVNATLDGYQALA